MLAIQSQQPRNLGFFGTRNMGFMHQQLIEVLAYAMLLTVSTPAGGACRWVARLRGPQCRPYPAGLTAVLHAGRRLMPTHVPGPPKQGNHIFTSGATGTNAAVIRGALRAEKPELLTVVLPQSMSKQPAESQELLQQVGRRVGWRW